MPTFCPRVTQIALSKLKGIYHLLCHAAMVDLTYYMQTPRVVNHTIYILLQVLMKQNTQFRVSAACHKFLDIFYYYYKGYVFKGHCDYLPSAVGMKT